MNHTPGPWIAKSNGHVTDSDHREIADIWFRSDECGIANERLIAAAPDLLAALQALVELHRLTPFHFDSTPVNMARAAIAKATGKDA